MAIVSILHRISGIILFLSIPLLLYILHESLDSQSTFTYIEKCLSYNLSKVVILVILASAVYHLFAGIRHLFMDCGLGESKSAGRVTAWFIILLTIVFVILLGVWLW